MSESHKSFRLVTAWLVFVCIILLSTPIICELSHFHIMSSPTVLTTSLTWYLAEHVVLLQSPSHLRDSDISTFDFRASMTRPSAHLRGFIQKGTLQGGRCHAVSLDFNINSLPRGKSWDQMALRLFGSIKCRVPIYCSLVAVVRGNHAWVTSTLPSSLSKRKIVRLRVDFPAANCRHILKTIWEGRVMRRVRSHESFPVTYLGDVHNLATREFHASHCKSHLDPLAN
jgi:hypothetical protein